MELFLPVLPENLNLRRISADDLLLDLQFFAADDEGRTEDPTERKKRKAREEGKVPKSQEISTALVLLFTFWGISLFGHFVLDGIKNLFTVFYGGIHEIKITQGNFSSQISSVVISFFKIVAPIMGIAVFVAVLANVVQVGFLFTLKPLKPDFSKIAFTPKKMFQRLFFSKQSMMNLFKSLFKVAAIGLIAYMVIKGDLRRIMNLMRIGVVQSLSLTTGIIFKLINACCLALVALAVPDYIFQRRQHMESLKMSIPEIKEEHKEEEGDPHVKQRIMQMSRELAQRNMPANVQSADVVITNPTHLAVALKFDLMQHNEPVIVAKGADRVAFRIRQLATDAGVPIMENKPLARALYPLEIGDSIPEELFEVVVGIYSRLEKFQTQFAGARGGV